MATSLISTIATATSVSEANVSLVLEELSDIVESTKNGSYEGTNFSGLEKFVYSTNVPGAGYAVNILTLPDRNISKLFNKVLNRVSRLTRVQKS